jgi:uncharacterized protein YegL
MRKLSVYFLIDISTPMCGENIHELNFALGYMINILRSDAQVLDSLWISIITYGTEVKEIIPLTKLVNIQLPELKCSSGGLRNTGKALGFLISQLDKIPLQINLHHKPLIFLISVRGPNDDELFLEMSSKLLSNEYGNSIAYICDSRSDIDWIKGFSDTIITCNGDQTDSYRKFFEWSSELIVTILIKDKNALYTDKTQIPKLHNQLMYINL